MKRGVSSVSRYSPIAFIAVVEVTFTDGRVVRFPTNARGWKASADGKTFVAPSVVCRYGSKPYGKFK